MIQPALELAYLGAMALLFGVALTTLSWMVDSWRTPEASAETAFPPPDDPHLSFSLLVPARHEEAVLANTVRRLLQSDHPQFEVLVIVGHDDPGTEAVAQQLAADDVRVRVVVDTNAVKNKPKALNTALPLCRGRVVGVFDAEDEVAPALLRHVDACFRATGAHVVQGGVQLMNLRSSWWSLRNVLEYFFWFSSRLHYHARARFIPLGGNTVFVRTDLLRKAAGWDPHCLAEDCELGVRLSSWGARVVVAFDPALATREETPPTLQGLFKQRTRWNQGFLQVLRKGEWRRLPTRAQRALAVYLLAMPFAQAATGLLLPISLFTMIFVKTPDLFVMLTFLPLLPTLATIAVEVVGLREFGRVFGIRIRVRDYALLVAGTLPYQIILAAAAVRASYREVRGVRTWEKTEHVNAHRLTGSDVPQGALR
ncbi:MAG: glycosyl transferase [Mycobacterium sp.]|nr:glycosyl transferase [Mycobacterium sp.]